MSSKRLRKKKQASKEQKRQMVQTAVKPEVSSLEHVPENKEAGCVKIQDAEELSGVCFQMEADFSQEEMEEMKTMNFYIQWNGREFCQADIAELIKKQWEAMGRTADSLEKLNIYLKPEEAKAYYVANDSVQGCVEL